MFVAQLLYLKKLWKAVLRQCDVYMQKTGKRGQRLSLLTSRTPLLYVPRSLAASRIMRKEIVSGAEDPFLRTLGLSPVDHSICTTETTWASGPVRTWPWSRVLEGPRPLLVPFALTTAGPRAPFQMGTPALQLCASGGFDEPAR